MMNDSLILLMGIACAGVGGELFVRGTVALAVASRLPPGLIAATLSAFATSSPEFFVSVRAASAGTPQLGLGDSMGSNVVNVALILALALTISGIHSPRDTVKREFPVALAVPVLTAFLFRDGLLSRREGLLLLGLFFGWCSAALWEARKQRRMAAAIAVDRSKAGIILNCIAGLCLLIAAGNLIVRGARGIALSAGIPDFIIGQTIVAVGTSVPELATTLIAKLRGHDEVGLGTLLGSNIFNGLFIVGVAALIHPIAVPWREVASALAFGLVSLAMIYPDRKGRIGKRRGFALLLLYGIYLVVALRG